MKNVFLFVALILALNVSAQIPGKKIDGPVKLLSGIKINEGDTLYVGTGTNPNGDFKFIYQPANYLVGNPQTNVTKSFQGTRVIIKHFKEFTNRKIGSKVWAVVSFGGGNCVVELEPALESKEIFLDRKELYKKDLPEKQKSNYSVADELIKLKTLLDAGLITKDEFDVQKKKILNE